MIQKNGKLIRLDEVRYFIVRLVYLIEVDILICTFYKNSYYYILFLFFTDLSDLAVYGVLSAIEGCDAFQDLLENTKVGPWFQRMKEACAQHKGQAIFH